VIVLSPRNAISKLSVYEETDNSTQKYQIELWFYKKNWGQLCVLLSQSLNPTFTPLNPTLRVGVGFFFPGWE
jgi:hypothetical protein